MNPSIHITSVVQPEKGAVMSCYCPECKTTQFFFAQHGTKPSDGDFWHMTEMCLDNPAHCMKMKPIKFERGMENVPPLRWVDRAR